MEIPSSLEAPLVVQLVAEGPDGPHPIAELGARESSVVRASSARDGVAQLRENNGRLPLRGNRLMERVARAHAEHIARDGRVTHLAGDRDPRDRLRNAGIEAERVGEAIACGEDRNAAFRALLESASHRSAILDARFTDAGIAEVSGERACVVVLLATWPRARP
jgi:uncharacterized protein YkwD